MHIHLSRQSVTLVELLIAISLIGLLVVGITSLSTYANFHLLTSDRWAQVQNELSFTLEDMSKNIVRATGNFNDPGIENIAGGFRVRVSVNPDVWISYTQSGNSIQKDVVDLSSRDVILNPGGFTYSQPPLDNGTGIKITLVGCFDPTAAIGICGSLDNPQLTMQTTVYSRSASSN